MHISEDQVKRTAVLAKLSLNNDEVSALRQQLQDLLDSAADMSLPDSLDAATTHNSTVHPTYFPGPDQGLKQEEVLALAPDSEQGFIRVPRVMSDD